jgi:small GTP-binding protein
LIDIPSEKKIAILGLDNAGKTSILTTVKQKFDIEKQIRNLKPTLKVERSGLEFLNHTIQNWDFGGQQKYRDEYLAHKDRYLSGIDLIFFVIDAQDSLRFDEAYEYFNEIMDYLKENEIKIPVVIMMHKVDPSSAEDPTITNNLSEIQEKFQPWLDYLQLRFFTTTVFDLESIIRAFSAGIRLMYSQTEAIASFIEGLVDKLKNVMALLIFEQSGISIGEYYLEHITLTMKKKILTMYEIAQKRIMARNINSYEFSDRIDAFTKVSGLIQAFSIDEITFYVLLIVEEHDDLETIIAEFNYFEQTYEEIKEILRTLLEDTPEEQSKLNPNNHAEIPSETTSVPIYEKDASEPEPVAEEDQSEDSEANPSEPENENPEE